jgi:rubrerythrin
MRLIDADALLSEMGKYSDLSARYKDEYLSGMQQRLETCIELVEDAQTVDAVPVKHGRWIHHKGGYSDHYECTACGKPIVLTAKWDFCPNCGAKMDGKDKI